MGEYMGRNTNVVAHTHETQQLSNHVRKRKGKERQEVRHQVRQGWTPVPRGKGEEVSEERKVRHQDRIRRPPSTSPPSSSTSPLRFLSWPETPPGTTRSPGSSQGTSSSPSGTMRS